MKPKIKALVYVVVGAGIIWLVYFYGWRPHALKNTGLASIKSKLNMPDKAKFDNVKVSYRAGFGAVCGEVSEKDITGKYGPSRRFIYTDVLDEGVIFPRERPESMGEELMNSVTWKMQCGYGSAEELIRISDHVAVLANKLEVVNNELRKLDGNLSAGVIDRRSYDSQKQGLNKTVETIDTEFEKVVNDNTIYQ